MFLSAAQQSEPGISLVALMVKKSACNAGVTGSWVEKIPWRRALLHTPVSLPGEFHGQRSLAGYSSQGCKESDMTERLSMYTYTCTSSLLDLLPSPLNPTPLSHEQRKIKKNREYVIGLAMRIQQTIKWHITFFLIIKSYTCSLWKTKKLKESMESST